MKQISGDRGGNMAIEYELKFAATEQVLDAVEQKLAGSWQRYAMRTTYYDTPSGALSAQKWTLRRRLENDESVCTLKTPAGVARREFEVRCESIEAAIPLLVEQGAPEALVSLTQEGMVEVCGAAFTRRACLVVLPEGAVEVALDSGELFGGGKRHPLCELEVELKSGDPSVALTFAGELALTYGLKPEHGSKFKRALALTR